MTDYGTDSGERIRTLGAIAIVAVIFSWLLTNLIGSMQVNLPFWVEGPSLLSVYGLAVWAFDEWGWRWASLRSVLRLRVPDLAGQWQGRLWSNFDGGRDRDDVRVTITQTWTRILIRLETGSSRSWSTVAAISTADPGQPILSYQYMNEPRADAAESMSTFKGTATLALVSSDRLEGDYYSGRGRNQFGRLSLDRAVGNASSVP